MHEKNQMLKQCIDLRACSYPNWYKKFRKISLKSICVPIPEQIVKYLLDEIIILPKECYANERTEAPNADNDITLADGDYDDALDTEQPEFPEFSDIIARKISALGGSAYIKTNWHSPKDAFWITAGQTMCCKDISDVYQLLKASSICKEDLVCHNLPVFDSSTANAHEDDGDTGNYSLSDDTRSADESAQPTNHFLIFKKWHDIHPGTEFRCFVRNKRIIGISPRDWPQYHKYICSQKIDIVNDIVSLFKEHIRPKFPLYDYVFDVVRNSKDCVYLLDFAPFDPKWADSLAFNWDELNAFDEDPIAVSYEEEDPEFRYLSSDCGIQPSKRNNYGIPKDVLDMFQVPGESSSSDSRNSQSSSNAETGQTSTDDQNDPKTLDDFINNRLEKIFQNQPNSNEDASSDESE